MPLIPPIPAPTTSRGRREQRPLWRSQPVLLLPPLGGAPVGPVPVPERGAEGKSGAPGLRQAASRLSGSPGTQQLPPQNASVPEGLERGEFRYQGGEGN